MTEPLCQADGRGWLAGRQPVFVSTRPDRQLDPAPLEAELTGSRMVVEGNPVNPAGAAFGPAELAGLGQRLAGRRNRCTAAGRRSRGPLRAGNSDRLVKVTSGSRSRPASTNLNEGLGRIERVLSGSSSPADQLSVHVVRS